MKLKLHNLCLLFVSFFIGLGVYANLNDSIVDVIKNSSGKEKVGHVRNYLESKEYVYEIDSLYPKLKKLFEGSSDEVKASFEHFVGLAYFNSFQEEEASVRHYLKGMKIAEQNKDSLNISNICYSLSGLYFWRQDFDKSLEYAQKCSAFYPSSAALNQKGNIYSLLGVLQQNIDNNYEEALKYHKLALETQKKGKHYNYATISLNNIAESYFFMNDFDKAKSYLEESIIVSDTTNMPESKAFANYIYGQVEVEKGNYIQGINKLSKAINWWEENRFKKDLRGGYKKLYKAYQKSGNFKEAIRVQDSLLALNERLYEERKIASLEEMRTKYETEQKELEIVKKQKETELAKQKTEMVSKEKRIQIIVFIIIGSLLILNAIYFFYRYKQQKRDKEIISSQKEVLTERNKEILDSITYAKRLQDAILPSEKIVKSFLLDSFILYKPKDIVAGDFYYMDVVEENNRKLIYYVAADCTGHGVPGAMVSIVGANGLKRCIQEFNLRKTGEVLDKLAELVSTNFSQSEEKIRDGMDLALCCLELENDEIKRVHYSGANNPLWVINPNRKTIPDTAKSFKEGGGFEIKADKQAIGYTENIKPFQSHTFEVQKGDTLYTFSDGYPDQFGGEKGKKLKSANFRKILFDIQENPMGEQLSILDKRFEDWRGDIEQLDDVCVIGVRL